MKLTDNEATRDLSDHKLPSVFSYRQAYFVGGHAMASKFSEYTIFILTKEDILMCAELLGISEEHITDDVLHQVKKGVEFGLEYWSDVVKVAIEEALMPPFNSPECDKI